MPLFIRIWFALDLALALTPSIHWSVSGGMPVLGLPRVLAYFLSLHLFVAASVVAAYLADRAPDGER